MNWTIKETFKYLCIKCMICTDSLKEILGILDDYDQDLSYMNEMDKKKLLERVGSYEELRDIVLKL